MSRGKSTEVRGGRKAELLGALAGWLMRGWAWTLRYELEDRCGVSEPGRLNRPLLIPLWHNRIFSIPPGWMKWVGRRRQVVVLTSASHDGATLARAMSVFGFGAVRGSSSRRAVAALVAMKRALAEGKDVAITPDGPRGPRYHFAPGVVKLAQAAGVPIAPVHATFSSAWRLKTWDGFVIPKPFSRVRVVFDELIHIPEVLDEEGFEAERRRVEAVMLGGVDDL
jgi:lysophospholipid acyltransferase (LPLAT)-like uncharacterized protein